MGPEEGKDAHRLAQLAPPDLSGNLRCGRIDTFQLRPDVSLEGGHAHPLLSISANPDDPCKPHVPSGLELVEGSLCCRSDFG